ncbi:tripartite motif-containing protein 42-like [Haliotis rubra]|uniref:tripartite motif-containing protein 42-like n=1 Tax=Haliotis rubra TaxID=36100 RepID=UPI001EE50AF3|nr:tripartite motif-containing protein 42-like [Haliotis rubra]
MATAKKLTENHLTCDICTKVFTDPATLQCNHTFCKSCLLKYTKTQSEAIQAKSIPCPFCRQQTQATNPGSPVKEWVSQLKPSHVIQSLMDDFGPGTEDPETSECSVCRNQQKQTPATSWCFSCNSSFCDGCLTLHGAMPFSLDHEVVVFSESTKSKTTPKRLFKCKHHASKQIELFCKDCKVAICTICCSINHRKCDDVDTIENMNPQVKEQLIKRNQELNIRIGNIKHGISVRKKQGDDFRCKIEEAKSQIRNTRAKLVKMIMEKEKQLLRDIDQTSTQYLHQIQTDIESKEIELQMYQQQYEFTVNAVTSSCEMNMYAVFESVCETSLDSKVTGIRPAPRRVVFTHNMEKLRKSVEEIHLGDVKITDCQVAGSVPDSKEIVTVTVYPHPVILSTIKTSNPYYSLAYLSPSRLVAGGIGRTDILDLEGNVLKSINTGKVSSADYIHVTGNRNLIVSGWEVKSLVSVTSEGKAVFTYTPTGDRALKYPHGITTTSTEDIMFADKGSHKVMQLTESGKFVKDVLTAWDGIDSPRGICLDTDAFLYVTCRNLLKVFRFEKH